MKRFLGALFVALVAACSSPEKAEAPAGPPRITDGDMTKADRAAFLATSDLVYASDYYSFVGRDAEGYVAFALDTNRGRDGTEFQAEHYGVLHDTRNGWDVPLKNGEFPNTAKELVGLTDSPYFTFRGEPHGPLTIAGVGNGLELRVDRLQGRVVRHDARTFYALLSGPATLRWQGRTLAGRVIYEDLLKTAFNRIARPSLFTFNKFNGFYLLTETGGDLYIHSSGKSALEVPEPVLGFIAEGARSEELGELRVEETAHGLGLGLYRWPTSWRASWKGSAGPATLRLEATSRRVMFNWVLGAYSMAVVEGELDEGGRKTKVYGLGELIR
jgi:hypothetical protein